MSQIHLSQFVPVCPILSFSLFSGPKPFVPVCPILSYICPILSYICSSLSQIRELRPAGHAQRGATDFLKEINTFIYYSDLCRKSICPSLSQFVLFCPILSYFHPICPILSQFVIFCPDFVLFCPIFVPVCPRFGNSNQPDMPDRCL